MKVFVFVLALAVLAICGDIANAAKRNKASKTMRAKGKKSGKRVVCSAVKCKRLEICLTLDGVSTCGCRQKCPSRVRPVCGNDGVTYDNQCELNRAACIVGSRIRRKFKGTCADGPSKGAGRLRQKRPTSKRRRPMLRPAHTTRKHLRLSPKAIQALPVKTNSSKVHAHPNKPRQKTQPAVNETKTTIAITNQNQLESKMAAEKTNRALRVKMEPTVVQGLTSRPVPIVRSHHAPLPRSRSLPVPNQPAVVPRQAMAVPGRTLIGPERKPLACYQLERDQLRLLLVAWMKSQADQKVSHSGGSSAHAYDAVLRHHFRSCDTNNDDALRSNEMLACMEQHSPHRTREVTRAKVHRGLCIDALIDMADENDDWRLSFEEFRKSMDPTLRTPNERCSLEDKEYKDGTQTSVNCNSCVCACGNWVCTETVCSSSTVHDVDHKYIIEQALLPSKRDRRDLLYGFKASNVINVNLIEDITKN